MSVINNHLAAGLVLCSTLVVGCAAAPGKPIGISAGEITPRIASTPSIVANTDPLVRAQLQLIATNLIATLVLTGIFMSGA